MEVAELLSVILQKLLYYGMPSIVRTVCTVRVLCFILILNLNLFFSAPAVAAEWTQYGSDTDGTHYYWVESQPSPGVVRVWDHLVYSAGGRALYMAKRQKAGMSVEGFDKVNHRNVVGEINCFSERAEYAVLEVLELTKDGKRLDYAKAGTYKDWQFIPEGSMLEKLSKTVCPEKRK
jgi:hypothetical protein